MSCVNCRDGRVTYRLKADVTDSEGEVELSFCSSECLSEWV